MRASPPLPVQVALPLPLDHPLTYIWPQTLQEKPCIGLRVLVPLGKRQVAGYVVAENPKEDFSQRGKRGKSFAYKEVLAVLDEEPLFGRKELAFYRWISDYYLAPIGEVLRTALPVSMHQRSFKALRILPQGILSLEKGDFLTKQELQILSLLKRKGKCTYKEMQSKLCGGLERSIQRLEKSGYVENCQIYKGGASRKSRGETVIECLLTSSDPTVNHWTSVLSPQQALIFQALLEEAPCPVKTFQTAYPGSARSLSELEDKGLIRLRCAEGPLPAPPLASITRVSAPELTNRQKEAVQAILPPLHNGDFHSFLLHGVTGSGKTEVYLQVIEQALKAERDVLILIPEIALTLQTVQRFSARFGSGIAVVHSQLTERERLDCWWKIRRGQVKIVIGARSAVFAPLKDLGVVVVDEEHDPSYKQQDRLRYNGRDLALLRGKQEKSVVILGSATPSLESYYNAQTGKSTLLELPERIHGRPHPKIDLIDMRDPASKQDPRDSISLVLEEELRQTLEKGKKSLVFLNRRGYSHTLICRACGHLFQCPHCSVSLTFHRARNRLCCHYCEYGKILPNRCPACQGIDIQPVGRGTERIEEEIKALSSTARVGRMDRDTTRKKGAHEQILQQFQGEELDILIGTQMITKGHDIPEVTLVGAILADASLDLPDFRASERTFQLLLQVAGRAGRGPWPGRVVIQTYHPDHYAIQSVCKQDYKAFYEKEVAFRRELGYPPFARMVNLRLTGREEEKVKRTASRVGDTARSLLAEYPRRYPGIEVLGPSQAPLSRLRERFRYNCFVKGNPPRTLLTLTKEILGRSKPFLSGGKVNLEVDVDPIQVL